jgi:hypothetical protein
VNDFYGIGRNAHPGVVMPDGADAQTRTRVQPATKLGADGWGRGPAWEPHAPARKHT